MKWNKRYVVWVVFGIVCLSLVLRLLFLDSASIHADEGATLFLSALDNARYLESAYGDVHPPLGYRYAHLFTLISVNEWWIRLSSVLASVAATFVLFILGRRMFDEKTGLIASLFFAVSQYHIRYAQVLRMYSLLVLLALLSVYFFWLWLKNKKRVHAVWYVIISVLLVYTHLYGAFVLFFQGVFVLWRYKKRFWRWVFLAGVSFVLFSPWLFVLQRQLYVMTTFIKSEWNGLVSLSLFGMDQYNVFVQFALHLFQFTSGYVRADINVLFGLIVLCSLAVWVLALIKLWPEVKNKNVHLSVLLLFGPMVLFFLVLLSGIIGVLPYSRHIMFASPFLYLLLAFGLSRCEKKWMVLGVVLFVLVNVFSLVSYYQVNPNVENWRLSSSLVSDDDVVYVYPPSYAYNSAYYLGENLILLPSLERFSYAMTMADVYSTHVSVDREGFCDFADDIADDEFVVLSMSEENVLHEQLLSCFSGFVLVDERVNAYRDVWGDIHEDIHVTRFHSPEPAAE